MSLFAFLCRAATAAVAGLLPAQWALAELQTSHRLIFADEFHGTSLDTSKWSAAYPGWTMPNSASTASAAHVSVGDGVLTLNATLTSGGFSSGSISTYQKYNFDGGYVEARIKLPTTPGSWPAFWGLYTGWPPEMDIMEYPLTTDGGANGYANDAYHTAFHYRNASGGNSAGAGKVNPSWLGDLSTGYHIFAADWWSDTSVRFYLDGVEVSSFTSGADVAEMVSMYMILDYAVGGWPGTPSTAQWPVGWSDQTKVDWVRVWQKNGGNDAPSSWTVNGGGAFGTGANWSAGVPKYGNQTAVFGRVGPAPTASVTLGAWHVLGGITFDGGADGTTAYTIGAPGSLIQLAGQVLGGTPTSALVLASSSGTVSQNVNARVELWSDATFKNDMAGGQTLNFNGAVSGNGKLTVTGVGTTVLGAAGSYRGGTQIGLNQEAAVLRATADAALGTGGVVIGPGGNATTARLEVAGNATLANDIDFRGRNNGSVGIRSLSGDNTLAGTTTANVGGGTYLIQSEAGNLTLAGAASGAAFPGVALRSAGGARTFTLQGAGNGIVGGRIANGDGTVSIVKAGGGTWTLSGANTYTGPTTVSAGRLRVSGSVATSAGVTVASGATFEAAGSHTVAALIVADGAAAEVTGPGIAVLTTRALTVASTGDPATQGGSIDLHAHALLFDYADAAAASSLATVRALAIRARDGGTWAGRGLGSSEVAASVGTNRLLAVGYVAATDLGGPGPISLGGGATATLPDATSVLVRATLAGDADLDGSVGLNDLVRLSNNYGTIGGQEWADGDFDYSGSVDLNDLVQLANNYGASLAASPSPAADFATDFAAAFDTAAAAADYAAVPEPHSLAMGAIAATAAIGPRRRRTTRRRPASPARPRNRPGAAA
ncbi:MAG: family 16 glycosylhydrolase [Phycisphaerae bacterium]